MAAHFRYVQRLFTEKFGVVLDKSKGGNPCHLRYVSYDSAPYINENATVMSRMYSESISPSHNFPRNYIHRYGDKSLLGHVVKMIQTAKEGERHTALLKAAKLAGGFIAAGRLDECTAVYALETVVSEWPMFGKSQRTIRDGIRYGREKPLYT